MREANDIEFIAKATAPNWAKFKDFFRGQGLPHRLRELEYQRRLTEQYCTDFRNLLAGRCGELSAIHEEEKAKGR